MTTTNLATYAQAINLQTRLVRRGILAPRIQHNILDGYFTVTGHTVVQCSCGEWIDRPDDESEQAYAQHVAAALMTVVAA